MKALIVLLFLFFLDPSAHAMGNRAIFPGNPLSPTERQHINDIEETTGKINQLSDPQGYEDQQMMEEKVAEEERVEEQEGIKKIEPKKEKPRPDEKPKVRHE